MSENNHVPGPWLCCVTFSEELGHTVYWVCSHTDTGIALDRGYWPEGYDIPTDEVYGKYHQPDDNAEIDPQKIANARLIAAAPLLLAACERALNYAENVLGSEGVYLDDNNDLPVIRAAIAKANGGVP